MVNFVLVFSTKSEVNKRRIHAEKKPCKKEEEWLVGNYSGYIFGAPEFHDSVPVLLAGDRLVPCTGLYI